jgi:hypothetical protein
VLQTDFPKGCLGSKGCAMAARVDLDSVVKEAGTERLEDATATYRFAHPLCFACIAMSVFEFRSIFAVVAF